jgi:renalase
MDRSKNPSVDVLIVGAGLTGLNLAKELSSDQPGLAIEILEKSKSCGGRMATRRVGDSRFDHGAQFIKNSEVAQTLIDFWQHAGILRAFPCSALSASCGLAGMTQLAKKMAESLPVSYNTKVTTLKSRDGGWHVGLDEGGARFAKDVVLTCPLPQSLEILNVSNIAYNPLLSKIHYSKAIVLLVQLDSSLDSEFVFKENVDENIFSICSQKEKGLSSLDEYTIVMQAKWSDDNYENADEEILTAGQALLKEKFVSKTFRIHQIKKWRFCQPIERWNSFYETPVPGLFLAGDAFGGASLAGALKSSYALEEHLMSSQYQLERRS